MAKTYHHGDLRSALIEATLAMIQADEAHLIGFRELARRLDVSRMAPYRHFESVDALLAVVAEEGYEKFLVDLDAVAAKTSLEKGERFIQLGMAYVNFALKNPAHYRLLFDQKFFENANYPRVQALAKKAFDVLKDVSSACIAPNASTRDKVMLANLAWASVHGLSSLLMNGQLRTVKNRDAFIRDSCERLLRIAF